MKKTYSKQHRENISKACKGRVSWSKGKKMPIESLYKNMISHLKYNVTMEWLTQFKDIEKLKFLNRSISRGRDKKGFNDSVYIQFIEKFYNDPQFNYLYDKWKTTNNKWMRPSLDHINAKCKGGDCLIENLQFLTWFENRTKMDMTQEEWKNVKINIKDYVL
jgi:hypothetical protein